MSIVARVFPRPKEQPGVYRIVNRRTGCVYVGATTKPMIERWDKHQRDLRAGRHHNKRLQADWTRLGAQAFRFVVVEVVRDPVLVFQREKHWQRQWYSPAGCYNPDPDIPFFALRRRRPIPPPTAEQLAPLLALLRRLDASREDARIALADCGLPLDNNLWRDAAPFRAPGASAAWGWLIAELDQRLGEAATGDLLAEFVRRLAEG